MIKQYSIIDLEVSIRNRGEQAIGGLQASPYHPDNEIVLYGSTNLLSALDYVWSLNQSEQEKWLDQTSNYHVHQSHKQLLDILLTADVLVGQNIKFDLLWLLREHPADVLVFLEKGGQIWDTQQAEYLLSGQQEMMAPLSSKYNKEGEMSREGLSRKYGGTEKDDRIKEYWDNGIDTSDIPLSELVEYCEYDLKNTAMVFLGQERAMREMGEDFTHLVGSQMEAIIATTIMEHNGMAFDVDRAAITANELATTFDTLVTTLTDSVQVEFDIQNDSAYSVPLESLNLNSVQQLNTFLFGGKFTFKADVTQYSDKGEPILYKSGIKKGEIKTKKEDIVINVDEPQGFLDINPLAFSVLAKTLKGYKLDEAAIDTLIAHTESGTTLAFLQGLKDYRRIHKDLNTYYMGLLKLVWPTDSCLHGSINHCTTGTGRLSSSSPNMQNISGKKG